MADQSLFLYLDRGRLLRFTEIVDLFSDYVEKPASLFQVFGDLHRDGLIGVRDRFRYSVELADGHVHQALEVWVYPTHFNHPQKTRELILTLKNSLPEIEGLSQVPFPIRTSLSRAVSEASLDKAAARKATLCGGDPPPLPCEKCDTTWKCLFGCKRELP